MLVSKSKKAKHIIYSNTSYTDLSFSKPVVLGKDLEPIPFKSIHTRFRAIFANTPFFGIKNYCWDLLKTRCKIVNEKACLVL